MNGSCCVVGRLQHAVAHAAEEQAELQPRRLQVLEQRLGEGAVTAAAVLGGLVGLRRHRHQGVARHGVHARQARRGRTTGGNVDRARQPFNERIVAACVQQDHAKLPSLRDLAEEQIERQRLVDQVALAFELRVGWQQVVLASHLHPVAGVIDDRHIGSLRLDAELSQRTAQLAKIRIIDLVDLEVQPTQRVTESLGRR